MRMPYEKPMIAIERYELTQTIASCATKVGFLNSECVLKDPDVTPQMKDLADIGFFVDGHCAIFADDMDRNDGICYHTNAGATFNS